MRISSIDGIVFAIVELSRIEESGDLNRDCEIASYVEKIAS